MAFSDRPHTHTFTHTLTSVLYKNKNQTHAVERKIVSLICLSAHVAYERFRVRWLRPRPRRRLRLRLQVQLQLWLHIVINA